LSPVESAVFWVAAVTAVLGGIGVVSSRSAIYSALSLIVTLAQLAVLYLLLNAQFIAAAQILVYAGAVMVLFLFVITLLGVQDIEFMGRHLPGQRVFSVAFAGALLLIVVYFVGQAPHALTAPHGAFNSQLATNNVAAFGRQLFTKFVFPFEATTLLLIVAMIGAVSLGRRQKTGAVVVGRREPVYTDALQENQNELVASRPAARGPDTATESMEEAHDAGA
jgi:NADH-quinone oxidoreductase subunit J